MSRAETIDVDSDVGQPVARGEHVLHVPPIQTHFLRSEHVKQTYKIQVMQPARRIHEAQRYPVVYVTDGNWVFDMFKSISYLLQMCTEDAPPFILVGVGYPGDSPFAGMLLRAREYTFPPYPKFKVQSAYKPGASGRVLKLYEGALLPEEGAKDFYGGEDFQNFFRDELIPYIDDKYDTVPGDRTYFGHSGGGFFGLLTLFKQTSLFKNYIVSSPGLLYHGEGPGGVQYEHYDCGAQMAREFIASAKSLEDVKLYMSIGAEEEFERVIEPWQIVSGFYQFSKIMKDAAIPGLNFMSEVFPGETHKTVWPIAFTHGIQAVFGTRRVARSVYW